MLQNHNFQTKPATLVALNQQNVTTKALIIISLNVFAVLEGEQFVVMPWIAYTGRNH